ncbi:MAG: hypothetical protein AAFY16_10790 [Cyanobacteria bacterium J06642_3]
MGIPLVTLITWILFIEVVVKILLFKAVPSLIINKTNLEEHTHLNIDIDLFNCNCSEINRIGFKKLVDYTSPSIKGMARLFYYPEYNCYAEVGMLAGTSSFCSIVSGFEQDWFFAATNNNSSTSNKAIAYAFLCLPRIMCKIFNEEPKLLFDSFLDWRSEVKNKLAVEIIAIADEEMYFTWESKKRKMQRQKLMHKSIVISLIKILLFSLNPKSEWMGDYSRTKLY